jgi:hypothetical protein
LARLSQWEGRALGVGGGEGGAAGARRAGGGREAGAGAGGAHATLTLQRPGRAAGAARAAGAGAAVGAAAAASGREPGVRRRAGGAQREDAAERGQWLCGAGRQVCGWPGGPSSGSLRPGPRSGAGSREPSRDSASAVQSRPRPCLAWPRGAGTTARPGHPKPSAGPGRAGVCGGPPGPPMGSGCRCGGATSRRRTPSWTPSSASLRARVSGGGGRTGRGSGGGSSSSECGWRGVPGPCAAQSASQWGLVVPRLQVGAVGARLGAGGRRHGTKVPCVVVCSRRLSSDFRNSGVHVTPRVCREGRMQVSSTLGA